MKLLVPPLRRPLAIVLIAGVCLLPSLPGCSRHAGSRPASALPAGDRAMLDEYEKIRAGLAADDLVAAKAAATTLAARLKPADAKAPAPAMLADVQSIATAAALDRARQKFGLLSVKVIPVAYGVEGYYVMTCPVPSSGDWVQRSAQADNPYLGKTMHEYGKLRK